MEEPVLKRIDLSSPTEEVEVKSVIKVPGWDIKCRDGIRAIELIVRCRGKFLEPPKFFEVLEGDVVIDAGAHVGIFSLYAASKGAEVHAFECSHKMLPIISRNISHSKYADRIELYNNAIAGINGKKVFANRGSQWVVDYIETKQEELNKENAMVAECITIESMMSELNLDKIDFLKMNIEGSEEGVFANIPDDVLRKINKISLSVHPFWCSTPLQNIHDKLIDNGFEVRIRGSRDVEEHGWWYAKRITE